MTGPKYRDYTATDGYEAELNRFESTQLDKPEKDNNDMELSTLLDNAADELDRLAARMDDFAGRNRLKFDYVTLAVFAGNLEMLQSIGIMPDRTAAMISRLNEIRAEIGKEAA